MRVLVCSNSSNLDVASQRMVFNLDNTKVWGFFLIEQMLLILIFSKN